MPSYKLYFTVFFTINQLTPRVNIFSLVVKKSMFFSLRLLNHEKYVFYEVGRKKCYFQSSILISKYLTHNSGFNDKAQNLKIHFLTTEKLPNVRLINIL